MIIQYEISDALLEEELENLTTHITGIAHETDEQNNQIFTAHIEASLVDVGEASDYDDAPLKEVFYRGSQELVDVYNTLYEENSQAYQYLSQLNWNWTEDKEYRNLLFIDSIFVSPAYRGKQLGLLTIYRTIQRFASNALLVVLDSRPLQCRENEELSPELGLDKYTTDRYRATSRLSFYFELLGFQSIPGSHYMVLNLDCKRPCIGDFRYPSKLETNESV